MIFYFDLKYRCSETAPGTYFAIDFGIPSSWDGPKSRLPPAAPKADRELGQSIARGGGPESKQEALGINKKGPPNGGANIGSKMWIRVCSSGFAFNMF